MKWEAMVVVNNVPMRMVTEAPNYITAEGYFKTFGKIVSTIRIVNG